MNPPSLTGRRRVSLQFFGMLLAVLFGSCGDDREIAMKETYQAMAPCPDSPNCVFSDAADDEHGIEPFRFEDVGPETAWEALRKVVEARPRTEVVEATGTYLHVEESSRFFGFVDDVEFQLRPAEGMIAVRSASRTGYSDLGVNRRRIEEIRSELRQRGIQ